MFKLTPKTTRQNTYTLTNPVNKNGLTQYAVILLSVFTRDLKGSRKEIVQETLGAKGYKIGSVWSSSAFNREFAAFNSCGLIVYDRNSRTWTKGPNLKRYLRSHNLI